MIEQAARQLRLREHRIVERRGVGGVHAAAAVAALRSTACSARASSPAPPPPIRRHRDVLLAATGVDTDELVHEVLIRFSSAFLDQGFAHWPLPDREADSIARSSTSTANRAACVPRWLQRPQARNGATAARATSRRWSRSKNRSQLLGVAAEQREAFITATLLALRGWAGMIWQMETNAEWAVRPAPRGSWSSSWPCGCCSIASPSAYVARGASGLSTARCATLRERGRGDARANGRRPADAAGVPGLSARAGAWAAARGAASPAGRRRGAGWPTRSRPSPNSNVAGVSTWPTSGATAIRRSTRLRSIRAARQPNAAVATPKLPVVSGRLLHRRARGIVPPAPGRDRPDVRDVRRRRVLRRGDVLSRRGRRPLPAALPGGDQAAALRRGAAGLHARGRRTGAGRERGDWSGRRRISSIAAAARCSAAP